MNERIRKIRKELGLSGEKFGEKLGVTRVAISNIENGNRNVTDQMFKSICREFNVNPDWLRNGEGEMLDLPITSPIKRDIIRLLDSVPENKLGYILAYIQGIVANESSH